jgi:hypothetical protein
VVIAHAFLALLAGFVCVAIVVVAMTALLQRFAPGWVGAERHPGPAYVFVNLGYSFLAAAAGGYVAAWMAGTAPLNTVLALGVVVLVMGAISALQARGKQPVWYQLALVVIAPLGVVAGGLIRLRTIGVL